MAVVFLMGGTGNQLFQYAASEPDDKFSTILLSSTVRSLLRWTQHEQLFAYPIASPIARLLAYVSLAIDLPLAKLTGRTLFSVLDSRSIKIRHPLVHPFVRLGYFQDAPLKRTMAPLGHQVSPEEQPDWIVLHVRGGDLLALERAGKNVYGMLAGDYYRTAIGHATDALHAKGVTPQRLIVLTDDPDYATTLDLDLKAAPQPEFVSCSLAETLACAVGAGWFVSSNSTLSYWIVRMREGICSIAPSPFQKRGDLDLPGATHRITKVYD